MDNIDRTDHEAISFIISPLVSHDCQNFCFLCNYKKADFEEFSACIPWDIIDFSGDIEVSWSLWKDLFLSAVDSTVPKVKWKQHKVKHWCNSATDSSKDIML